jgi:hypothetical protein
VVLGRWSPRRWRAGPETGRQAGLPARRTHVGARAKTKRTRAPRFRVGASASGTWKGRASSWRHLLRESARGAAGRGGGCGRKRNQTNPKSAEILALGRDEGGRARRVPAPLALGPCTMRLLRGWRHVRGAAPRSRPLCDRFLPVPPLARLAWPPSAAGLASAGAAQRKSWMRVTRRPPRPCFSIACSQVVNSSLERL